LLTPGKSTFLFATIKLCFLGGGENGWLWGLWLPTMLTHWDLLFLPYILAHVHTYIYTKGSLINFKYFAVKILKKNNLPSFRATYMWYSEGNPMPNSFQRTHLSFNANSLFLCDLFSSTMKKKRDKRAQGKWSSFLLKSWHTQQNSQSFAFSNHGSLVRPRHFSFFCFVSWLPHKFRVI